MSTPIRKFGLKPGPDPRRNLYPLTSSVSQAPPGPIQYKYLFNPPEDQGNEGTCVAFGTGGLVEAFYMKRTKAKGFYVSKAATFSKAKYAYESGDIADDGLVVSDGLLVFQNFGYVDNSDYPYQNTDAQILAPVPANLTWHTLDTLTSFSAVPLDLNSLRLAMYQHGPLVIGVRWPNSWMNAPSNGVLSDKGLDDIAGGHCISIVDDGGTESGNEHEGYFTIRNNWSQTWADGGCAYVKHETMLKVLTDCYTIVVPT
jgi:C1A family cysteine protease